MSTKNRSFADPISVYIKLKQEKLQICFAFPFKNKTSVKADVMYRKFKEFLKIGGLFWTKFCSNWFRLNFLKMQLLSHFRSFKIKIRSSSSLRYYVEHVTSVGVILRALTFEQHSYEKRRSGSEPQAKLCLV